MRFLYYFLGFTFLFFSCKEEDNAPVKPEDKINNTDNRSSSLSDTLSFNTTDTLDHTDTDSELINTFLYASLANDNQIAVYQVDTVNGTLLFIEKAPANGSVGSLAISRSGKYLYAAIRSTGEVSTYTINNQTGGLKHIGTTKVVDNPVYITPDKTNKFLLTAYYNAGKMAIFPIIGDSVVGSSAIVNINAGTNPHCIMTDPGNQYLFMAVKGSDCILQFHFNESAGTVLSNSPDRVTSEIGAGPRHITFHPQKDIVYVVNEVNSTVSVFNLSHTGLLTSLQNISTLPDGYAGDNTCADIHITYDGRYLYASNRGHNSIAAFAVDSSSGQLMLIDQYDTEPVPREFAISPKGDFLYAGGESSGKIAAYHIQADGSLSQFTTYDAGSSVTWVLVERIKINPPVTTGINDWYIK